MRLAFSILIAGVTALLSACNGRAASRRDTLATLRPSCTAGALTDAEYNRPIPLLDAPNGRTLYEVRNDTAGGDVWMVELREHVNGFFHAALSTMNDSSRSGWIAARYVGIFARNYSQPLTLYASPDSTSAVTSVVSEWWPKLYSVTDCAGKWLRVRATISGKTHEGWMPPRMQCDNPFTTCN
jgi:hypothetical protein